MSSAAFAVYYDSDPVAARVAPVAGTFVERLKTLPPTAHALEVRTELDLAQLPMAALLSLFNRAAALRDARAVDRFESRHAGARRLFRVLGVLAEEPPPPAPRPPTVLDVNGLPRAGDDRRVRLLVAENPKRAGSKAAERFARYRDGMTIGEALAAGIRRDDLRWDAARNFVRFEEDPTR